MTEQVACLCHTLYLRTVVGTVTMFYEYRLASRGPQSEPVEVCPECGRMLDMSTTKPASDELNNNSLH